MAPKALKCMWNIFPSIQIYYYYYDAFFFYLNFSWYSSTGWGMFSCISTTEYSFNSLQKSSILTGKSKAHLYLLWIGEGTTCYRSFVRIARGKSARTTSWLRRLRSNTQWNSTNTLAPICLSAERGNKGYDRNSRKPCCKPSSLSSRQSFTPSSWTRISSSAHRGCVNLRALAGLALVKRPWTTWSHPSSSPVEEVATLAVLIAHLPSSPQVRPCLAALYFFQ